MDCWRSLYDLLWHCACGHRLGRGHVRLCNRGGDSGPSWYISAGVHAAVPGEQVASSLPNWEGRGKVGEGVIDQFGGAPLV